MNTTNEFGLFIKYASSNNHRENEPYTHIFSFKEDDHSLANLISKETGVPVVDIEIVDDKLILPEEVEDAYPAIVSNNMTESFKYLTISNILDNDVRFSGYCFISLFLDKTELPLKIKDNTLYLYSKDEVSVDKNQPHIQTVEEPQEEPDLIA